MKTMKLLAATSLFLCLCVPLTANVIRDDRDDSLYLALGAQYASVGRVDVNARNGQFTGSGTLITSDWVLTAGHVLDKAKSLNFRVGGKTYAADRWVKNPGWNGNLSSGTDIGLMHLSAPVAGITPATRYAGTSELDAVGTFVGYGMSGTGLTGATTPAGQKRGAQNVIDAYYQGRRSANTNILLADFDNPDKASDSRLGSALPLDLEGLIAPGDSGGGLFIDVAGQTLLAGVHSFGMAYDGKVDSDYGDLSGDTRVSAFNAWIDSILNKYAYLSVPLGAALDGGGAALVVQSVPEPASMTLLAFGGALLAFRRRLSRAT